MGLFGGGSKSSSTTTNYTQTTSQTVGDLAKGNIQSAGDVTVNGFYAVSYTHLPLPPTERV